MYALLQRWQVEVCSFGWEERSARGRTEKINWEMSLICLFVIDFGKEKGPPGRKPSAEKKRAVLWSMSFMVVFWTALIAVVRIFLAML